MKKTKPFHVKILIVVALAVASILFLLSFNDYLQPYLEEEMTVALIPVILFILFMKLIGFGGQPKYIDGKNILLVLISILYQIRIVLAFLILFVMLYHSFGKNDSLLNIMGEYMTGETSEQVLTVYDVKNEFVYDHKNRIYYLYNKDTELKEQYTYKITYLDTSRIIIDVDGPLNQEKFELEDTVQIKEVEYKNGTISLKWDPFYWNGEESEKYRVKSYRKRSDGTLMRSGSQIVVKDKATTTTIENLLDNEEYQFVVEPYFDNEFDEEHRGISEFITTK